MILDTFTAPEIVWRIKLRPRIAEAIEAVESTVTETAASAWAHFRESVAAVLERAPQHHEALRDLTTELRRRVLGPDPVLATDDA